MKRTFRSQRREILVLDHLHGRRDVTCKLTWDDSQRRFFAQHSIAMFNVATSRNHVATMLLRCSIALKIVVAIVTSPSACMLGFPNSDHVIYSPWILPFVFFTHTCAWDGI